MMNKVIYTPISDKTYLGVATVLSYDTTINSCLSDFLISTEQRTERKILVDLALKVGLNEYRFVDYDVDEDGKILFNSSRYLHPTKKIIQIADSFIKQQREIVENSMITKSARKYFKN